MTVRPLAGVFVGGKSSRMGSPKGLLVGPHGKPLVQHLVELARAECDEVVLVGKARDYRDLCPEVRRIPDAPGIDGPLAGLLALLREAGPRDAVALACDLAHLEQPLLAKLVQLEPGGEVLAPREPNGLWQPLFARYAPSAREKLEAAAAEGVRSFQKLFERLRCEELALDEAERRQLRDWDTPADIHGQ